MKYLFLLLLCCTSFALYSQNARTSSTVSIGVTVHIDSVHRDAQPLQDSLQSQPSPAQKEPAKGK